MFKSLKCYRVKFLSPQHICAFCNKKLSFWSGSFANSITSENSASKSVSLLQRQVSLIQCCNMLENSSHIGCFLKCQRQSTVLLQTTYQMCYNFLFSCSCADTKISLPNKKYLLKSTQKIKQFKFKPISGITINYKFLLVTWPVFEFNNKSMVLHCVLQIIRHNKRLFHSVGLVA